jgi:hypothetical protein
MKNKIYLKIFVILVFIALFGCNTYKEFTVPEKYIYIKYKDSNNIGTPRMKSFAKEYIKGFTQGRITSKIRNDTIFFKLFNNEGTRLDRDSWRYEQQFKASKLNCTKRLRIDVGRLTFYFCYADVKELAQKLSKNKDEYISKLYTSLGEKLISLEEKFDEKTHNFANGFFLSKLLRNIDFEIKDSGNEHITEVRIGDINTGWSISDELYLLNQKKDTVAAFFNTYLIE